MAFVYQLPTFVVSVEVLLTQRICLIRGILFRSRQRLRFVSVLKMQFSLEISVILFLGDGSDEPASCGKNLHIELLHSDLDYPV